MWGSKIQFQLVRVERPTSCRQRQPPRSYKDAGDDLTNKHRANSAKIMGWWARYSTNHLSDRVGSCSWSVRSERVARLCCVRSRRALLMQCSQIQSIHVSQTRVQAFQWLHLYPLRISHGDICSFHFHWSPILISLIAKLFVKSREISMHPVKFYELSTCAWGISLRNF